ncbi:hypothetical protein EK21DRAFT_67528 [Setomelanomma holmii]|uniref:Uncharacterized protein n=1 Tax=Setomelanomma holmii TaxID=210430 RepID=A0A9P4LJS8_9PLEO|nr:hypothetical protein EK21DRAFT_67528 [Setomelanomma holmii]
MQARNAFKSYFLAVHRLALLKQCDIHQFWAHQSLEENLAFLRVCKLKMLRVVVREVVKLQREIGRNKKAMRHWRRKEKGLHGWYMDGALYV